VAVGGSAATLSKSVVAGNAVALHAQDGSTVTEVNELPATVGMLDVLVTRDTRFEGNDVTLGVGSVPLPSAL
jgi:hypothetical protein